ncbi:MAG: hypothetical protein LCH96_14805 [Actinobacteria bacterium]|nr:hypothetical protein [Actinomycetota bacterium]
MTPPVRTPYRGAPSAGDLVIAYRDQEDMDAGVAVLNGVIELVRCSGGTRWSVHYKDGNRRADEVVNLNGCLVFLVSAGSRMLGYNGPWRL